jgi:hypothetical protein
MVTDFCDKPQVLARNHQTAPVQGQRSANRLRLGVSASLELTSGARPCLIDDISSTGAHLRIEQALAAGSTAILHFHDLHLYTSVVWCKQGECGIRFEKPLPLEDMQGMLWITQNRELYDRMCQESHAEQWTQGIWE